MPTNPTIGTDYDHIDAMNLGAGTGVVRHMLKDAKARANIAPAFSSSASYSAGDYVIYDGNLMQFTAAHSGAWTGSDAVSVTVSSGLSNGPVLYSKAQSLAGAQKAQARENIGAAQVSPTDFNGSGTGMFIEY